MNKPHTITRSSPAGFTLLEILIAMSLFSLAILVLYSGLHTAALGWQSSERQITANDNQRIQLAFVKRLITQAIPLTLYDGRDNSLLFRGEQQAIHFIAPLPSHRGGEWAYLVSIQSVPGREADDLMLYYQPVREDITLPRNIPVDTPDVSILEGIQSIEFAYYGSKSAESKPDWHDDWEVNDRLPELVSFQIVMQDPDIYMPEIVAAIHTRPLRGQLQQVIYAPSSTSDRNTATDESTTPP
jgi:general secretion pathway protein J